MTSPLWPRSFTAESLSVLRVCPYQYQRRHMEGVPERIFSGLGRGPGELNRAQVGEIIHRCLELFDFAAGANLPRLLKTAADSLGLPPPAPDQGAEILEMLERLHRSPLAELLATAEWRRHEVPFVCQVGAQGDRGTAAGPPPPGAVGAELVSAPNWEHTRCSPTGVPPPEIRIRGQVDCILETKGGEFVLLDYKTHDVEESSIAAVFPQHEFQMQIYAYGLRQARGRGQEAGSSRQGALPIDDRSPTTLIWYLRPGLAHEVEVWPMEKGEEEIISCARIILQLEELPLPKRSQLDQVCRLCGYYPWGCAGPPTE